MMTESRELWEEAIGNHVKRKYLYFMQKTAYEISTCLVGSEMYMRDRIRGVRAKPMVWPCCNIAQGNAVTHTHLTLPTTYSV